MINNRDAKDAMDILMIQLDKICKEAIEHWPDAEKWPVIIESQKLLKEIQEAL